MERSWILWSRKYPSDCVCLVKFINDEEMEEIKKYELHSIFLAGGSDVHSAGCGFFSGLIRFSPFYQAGKNREICLTLPHSCQSIELFEELLEFMYSGNKASFHIEEKNLIALLSLADCFLVKDLEEHIEHLIKELGNTKERSKCCHSYLFFLLQCYEHQLSDHSLAEYLFNWLAEAFTSDEIDAKMIANNMPLQIQREIIKKSKEKANRDRNYSQWGIRCCNLLKALEDNEEKLENHKDYETIAEEILSSFERIRHFINQENLIILISVAFQSPILEEFRNLLIAHGASKYGVHNWDELPFAGFERIISEPNLTFEGGEIKLALSVQSYIHKNQDQLSKEMIENLWNHVQVELISNDTAIADICTILSQQKTVSQSQTLPTEVLIRKMNGLMETHDNKNCDKRLVSLSNSSNNISESSSHQIFIAGGISNKKMLDDAYVYNVTENEWTRSPSLISPSCGATSCIINDDLCNRTLFTIGGLIQDQFGTHPSNNISSFDINDATWSENISLFMARSGHSSMSMSNAIYSLGGITWDNGPCGSNNEISYLSSVERINTATRKCVQLADMNEKRSGLSAANWNGNLIAIGGRPKVNSYLSSVEYYDPHCDQWIIYPNSLSIPRYCHNSDVCNGSIYIFGGINSNGICRSVERFDPRMSLRKSEIINNSDIGKRKLFGIATINSKIYLIGGRDDQENCINTLNWFDTRTNQWNHNESIYLPNNMGRYGLIVQKL